MYLKYLGGVVLITALAKLEFFFTECNMLASAKFGWFTLYGTNSISISRVTGISYFTWHHSSRGVNCVFLNIEKFGEYVSVSVRVFIDEVFVQIIAYRAMAQFDDWAFGFLHTWNWISSLFNMHWKELFKNYLPLSVRTQRGRLRRGLEYFGSLNIDRNAEATAGNVLDFSGTMYRNLEKSTITIDKYLYVSLNILRVWT